MACLFTRTVNPDNWGEIFQSIEAFEPLIKEIFKRHHLIYTETQNLTPGTNAVFKVGDKAVKIFAPEESGFYHHDFDIEIAAQQHANRRDVASPRLLYQGQVEDAYLFRYIVMEYIAGREAGDMRQSFTAEQKQDFAQRLRRITSRLNISITNSAIPLLTEDDCLANTQWDGFSQAFRKDRRSILQRITFGGRVYTHGDLTAENILIGDDGDIYIIDFADSRIAPPYYEWPPLVFSAFNCDPVMMQGYFGAYRQDDFYDQLTAGVLMHAFGGSIVQELCAAADKPVESLSDVSALRGFLTDCVNKGGAAF